jgi:flagellar M-ring protein FliF
MSTASTAAPGSLLDQLRANPRLPLAIGVSVVVAAVAALWLWSRTPDYGVLYSNLSDRDGGAIIASLQQMNIPYKFAEGGGALMVQANKVPEARLRLASQGLPKGGSAGFELMDNQKFGTSQFVEQVNYQRALEGELARSINSISAVDSARVHLALPKPSLFVREQKSPSASVVLTLHRGRSIDEGQVSAIVHLISSSVPELSAKAITVVDQAGNLLSAANSGARGLDVSQLKYTSEIEQGFIRRIEAILQPIVGSANVRAQVAADIDFSVVEATDEKYKPNQEPGTAAIRSQQSSESAQPGNTTPGGVPGALTNQPQITPIAPISTAPAVAPKPGTPAADQMKISTELGSLGSLGNLSSLGGIARSGGSGRKDGTTNYELDRSIRHVQQGAGGIKRLSVAVVVNYRTAAGTQGKPTAQALSPAELEQIQNLVKEAMGFNRDRGDSVNVVNSLFATDVVETVDVPAWRQAGNIDMAKTLGQYLLLGLAALFVWFAVLRPLLRKHLQPAGAVAPPLGRQEPQPDVAGAPAVASVQAQAAQREGQRHVDNVKYAQDASANDPRMVAALIQNWIKT